MVILETIADLTPLLEYSCIWTVDLECEDPKSMPEQLKWLQDNPGIIAALLLEEEDLDRPIVCKKIELSMPDKFFSFD